VDETQEETMKPRVICISRALAAGGEDIARAVSQRLGFRYVDEEIIDQAAEKEQVDVSVIEDAERRKSFLDRLLESFAVAPTPEAMTFAAGFPAAPLPIESVASIRTTEHYRQLIRDVVKETAQQGDVVIFAHASAMALGARNDVLRVLVTASSQTRAKRLGEAHGMSSQEAEKAIKESDKSRRAYLNTFYGVSEELPTHYDLVVNTDLLSPHRAVDVILAAALG
jgi:cytidylate kinase